tara:strand:+ start:323 stop:526 length:204 start_codon:yes stop_codon:yes gene_type:complete
MTNVIIVGHCNHSNITLSEIEQLDYFHKPEPLIISSSGMYKDFVHIKEESQQLPQKVKHRKKIKFHN